MSFNRNCKYALILIVTFLEVGYLHAQCKIGLFDNNIDIGKVENPGFAFYNEKNQTYTIGGSSAINSNDDGGFHYLWTTQQGDFIVRAEVEFLDSSSKHKRNIGWIIKNDLDVNTPHVKASVYGNGHTLFHNRTDIDAETEIDKTNISKPIVIQLERRGDEFIMSTSTFGAPLKAVKTINSSIINQVFVGLYVCSQDPELIEVAKFRNVRIIRPASADLVQGKDYLGSHLEILEISTGHRKILHSTSNSIQAPNWTPDGEKLIYNSEGRLYSYQLKEGKIRPFDTGFAINNNNDHVLTFDGTILGISHHNESDNHQSTLYYLPLEDEASPIKVTPNGAGNSYLHGWSPDNKKMLFTGYRNGQFDIYSVNIFTGKEHQLTNQKTLDDGSEYSPDGKYIFFNSVRTGKMKIWRMDINGDHKVQLTYDEYNDWFPHVSPDKKWIVFISFPKDINPSDHPFYKHCLLRMIPYNGGTPKIIGYIYGGQGSINVPSWSPDSKYISFVSNGKI